jgi:hypothetical protein
MRQFANESGSKDTVSITARIIKETPNAILISAPDDTEIWLPKSQIKVQGDGTEIEVPLWLYEKSLEEHGF